MYASTWICTKEVNISLEEFRNSIRKGSLSELRI